ncbi:hypothetical protein ACLOAU_04575 [Niabella sp. CJ426]|uniref:hypothetical protein n=1 Tax=Niabella sp. CJ426 TaxID=3393740 RepID=UPI003D092EBC
MNQENTDRLLKVLLYTGFGDVNVKDLNKALSTGANKVDYPISLDFKSKGGIQTVDYLLHLNKGKTDNYFFNAFSLRDPEGDAKFYINKGQKNITAKEAFNLLEKRPVYKELTTKDNKKYSAWIEIDFKKSVPEKLAFNRYNDNYGFDVKNSLKELNSKGLIFPTTLDNVMERLKKGEAVEATNLDKSESYFIEACPQLKTCIPKNENGAEINLTDQQTQSQNNARSMGR